MPNFQVQLINDTPYNRTNTLVTVGIPFAQGEVTSSSTTFVVAGALNNGETRKVQWYPQGPVYPDGSYKYGRMSFLADMSASSDKEVTVLTSETFTPSPFIEKPIITSSFVNNQSFGLILLDNNHLLDFTTATVVEGGNGNDVYKRYKKFERHALYPEVWIEVCFDVISNADYIRFWYTFGFCYAQRNMGRNPGLYPYAKFPGPRTANGLFPSMGQGPILWVQGGKSAIYDEAVSLTSIVKIDSAAAYFVMDPIGRAINKHNCLNWGQFMNYKGVMFASTAINSDNALASYDKEIFAMAMNWSPNRYPYYYSLPDYSPGIDDREEAKTRLRNYTQEFTNQYALADPFASNPWGNIPNAPGTGDQGYNGYAFGALRGWPWLKTAWPIAQKSIQLAVRTLGYRASFYREADGTKFKYSNHPGVLIWYTALFDNSANPQKLGLGTAAPFDLPYDIRTFSQHSGPDRQHASFHMLMFDALVTMDWVALEIAEYLAEMTLAAHDSTTISPSINGSDSSRGIGRGHQSCCALYEITGKTQIIDILVGRINNTIYPQFLSLAPTSGGDFPEKVRFLAIYGPETKTGALRDLLHHRPWECAIGIMGLYAFYILLQKHRPSETSVVAKLAEMITKVSGSILEYGLIDTRTTTQSIVVNEWTGTLGEWIGTMGLTLTSSTASGTITQFSYPDGVNGTPSATSTVSVVPALILIVTNVTGQFAAGQTVTLSGGRTGKIIIRHVPAVGIPAIAEGTGVPGLQRGDPLPQSLWSTRIVTGTDSYPGVHRYMYHYHGYTLWSIPGPVLAQVAALNNLFTSNNAAIYSKATDYINTIKSNRFIPANSWKDDMEGYMGMTPLAFNAQSTGNDMIVTVGSPQSLRFSRPATTVTTTTNISVNITADPVVFQLINKTPQIIATSPTASNAIISIGKSTLAASTFAHQVLTFSITNNNISLSGPTNLVLSSPSALVLVFNSSNSSISKVLTLTLTTTAPGIGPTVSESPFDAPGDPHLDFV